MSELLKNLSSVPSEAWVGLMGVIIGAILSTFGVWLTNSASLKQLKIQLFHQKEEGKILIKRERLEELYILTDRWIGIFANQFLCLSLVMKGEIDYDQYFDMVIGEGKSGQVEFVRLKMILDIYGQEIKRDFQSIFDCRDEINDIISKHKERYNEDGVNDSSYFEPFATKSLEISKRGGLVLEKIASLSRGL